jgi:hypothetical protein
MAQVKPDGGQGHGKSYRLNPPAQLWRASRRGATPGDLAQAAGPPDVPDASPANR